MDALVASGSRAHVVKIAAAGVEARPAPVRFNGNHRKVLDHLAETDLPVTVLAPNGFMENLRHSAASIARGQFFRSVTDGAISLIAARDIGEVAAHVLADPSPHAGAVYTLTGPEALTYAQVTQTLEAATGHPVAFVPVEPGQAQESMLAPGYPEWNVEGLLELDQIYQAGHGRAVTDEVRKATGRPATSLAQWAQEHAATFRG